MQTRAPGADPGDPAVVPRTPNRIPRNRRVVYPLSTNTERVGVSPAQPEEEAVNRRRLFLRVLAYAAIVAAAGLLAGCAARKPPAASWGDPETGLILEYRMPEKAPLKYEMTSEFMQSMDMGDQSLDTESTQVTAMSISSRGTGGDGLLLTVMIDDASVSVDAPGGVSLDPDMTDVVGRSFDMALSVLGEERDFPPSDAIEYDMGPAGKRSAISMIQMMFPDTAGRPVKIGDSWTTVDGFSESGSSGDMSMSYESVSTLVGIETVEGMSCAKIESEFTGTSEGSGTQGPAKWSSEGAIEGVSTWYFAYEKGVLVKEVSEGTGTSTVVAGTPQGDLTIPTMQQFSSETLLVK
jgi:hypothetical protein